MVVGRESFCNSKLSSRVPDVKSIGTIGKLAKLGVQELVVAFEFCSEVTR